MLTINKQSQDLHQIAGLQDLSHENAAAVSGGAAILADGFNLKGALIRLHGRRGTRFSNLGRFNNRASSVAIAPGEIWRFWTSTNLRGLRITLGRGTYNLGGAANNNIESAQRL